MYVDINKNAVLFYKALDDIWCAERTYYGSPNNAVWSCCQAAEKIMKGFLLCCGVAHDSTHDLAIILELVESEHALQESTTASIYNLARYDQRLRYKNLKSDPTPGDAQATIEKVVRETGTIPVSLFERQLITSFVHQMIFILSLKN